MTICVDTITLDREKIQQNAVKLVGKSASDETKKKAQLKLLIEVIAHELCHSKLHPDPEANDKDPSFPKREDPAYYGMKLGKCEKTLYKNATGQDSPSFKKTAFKVPFDVTLTPAMQTILTNHPDYFASVNAAVKALEYAPTYSVTWTPYPK